MGPVGNLDGTMRRDVWPRQHGRLVLRNRRCGKPDFLGFGDWAGQRSAIIVVVVLVIVVIILIVTFIMLVCIMKVLIIIMIIIIDIRYWILNI